MLNERNDDLVYCITYFESIIYLKKKACKQALFFSPEKLPVLFYESNSNTIQ
jgi:hypothetical protein